MAYILRLTPRFEKNFQPLTKKDHVLRDRVYGKLSEIRGNPYIGETLSHILVGMISTHVGNRVIIYTLDPLKSLYRTMKMLKMIDLA